MSGSRALQASAPGRCGIIGNPSDIYGGVVVSCSVPARATCRLTVASSSNLPSDPTLWRAATSRFPVANATVEWWSAIPASGGLAGSTALLASALATAMEANGQPPDLETAEGRIALSELLRDVERNEAGIVCGYQDAYMAVHGGLQAMDFAGKSPSNPGSPGKLRALTADLPFLLVTTGVKRLSGSVHGPIAERWQRGDPEVVEKMLRVREIGIAGSRALTTGDWIALAELMNENQAITASLGGSGEAIDALVEDALCCGALGAKLAGAGMGGTVIALAGDLADLERRLQDRGYTQFMRPSFEPGLRFEESI